MIKRGHVLPQIIQNISKAISCSLQTGSKDLLLKKTITYITEQIEIKLIPILSLHWLVCMVLESLLHATGGGGTQTLLQPFCLKW